MPLLLLEKPGHQMPHTKWLPRGKSRRKAPWIPWAGRRENESESLANGCVKTQKTSSQHDPQIRMQIQHAHVCIKYIQIKLTTGGVADKQDEARKDHGSTKREPG